MTHDTPEDPRSRLLAAGRRILSQRRALSFDPLGIDLRLAVEESGVPRSTAYRTFTIDGGRPQTNFTRALICSLVEDGLITSIDALSAVFASVVESSPANIFEDGTPLELARLLRECVRQATWHNAHELAATPSFWIYMNSLVSSSPVLADNEGDSAELTTLLDALREADRPGDMREFYREMAGRFGLELAEGWTWDKVEAAIAAASYGTSMRLHVNPDLIITRPTGPQGELQEWTASGCLIEALVVTMTRPNTRIRNAADLSVWTAHG